MSEIIYGGELYHFGTKGMKWGVRKYQNEDGSLTPAGQKRYNVSNAKSEFKAAKERYKDASRSATLSARSAWGVKRLNESRRLDAERDSAELDMIDKRAALAKARKNERAEMKSYARAMSKSGLAGSAHDTQSGGRSSRIYDHLAATRGEEYANAVSKKARNSMITKAAVGIGAVIVKNVLLNKAVNS